MNYISTRDKSVKVSAAQAIAQGISAEGGLFVPETLPCITADRLASLVGKSYTDRACDILGEFLTDFTAEELRRCVEGAYRDTFADPAVAPLSRLGTSTYMLELWHGPTCAFKDMALQLLPHLLTTSVGKVAKGREVVILVATSGDTGKAALEGFRDVEGTRILVFYPQDGVSDIQKLQMQTQEGANVAVCGVDGNFDDAQTGVKKIFTDPQLNSELAARNTMFSSANSINWGRLAPQIVYYFSAYCDMVHTEEIVLGDVVNVAVPTGNFGNILAAYYAKKMGLPLGKFICASNINNVLTDFIRSGTYDRRRDFTPTVSPSMDILISSNLERLLFALSGGDDAAVSGWMRGLAESSSYSVNPQVKEALQAEFWGGFCDEANTAKTLKSTWENYNYLCDTHTAVAVHVLDEYRKKTGDDAKAIVASTANPYKFAGSILASLDGGAEADGFAQMKALQARTGEPIPSQLLSLRDKPVRFQKSVARDALAGEVRELLGL